jgi:hypothetical protein
MRKRDFATPAAQAEGPTNQVVALSVLASLGGAQRFVDIEEITLAAFTLAPARYSWRTRTDLPSPERVRWALVHANQKSDKVPLVVQSNDGSSWKLTAEGVAFTQEHAGEMTRAKMAPPRSGKDAGRAAERVSAIRKHLLFRAYQQGGSIAERPRHELADLLICPPDSPLAFVLRRVDAAKAAALDVDDDEVSVFLQGLEAEVRRQWS